MVTENWTVNFFCFGTAPMTMVKVMVMVMVVIMVAVES